MTPQHEIERLHWNLAGMEAQSELARIRAMNPRPVPASKLSRRDRYAQIATLLVILLVMAFSAWRSS